MMKNKEEMKNNKNDRSINFILRIYFLWMSKYFFFFRP